MESTMKTYATRIESNEINPVIYYDGASSGLIVNPEDPDVPLEILGFGILQLSDGPFEFETNSLEMVFVPQEGTYEISVNNEIYTGEREGGPFSMPPGKTNASCVYAPEGSKVIIKGIGELAFFQAPALRELSPRQVNPAEAEISSRGSGIWRRNIINLIGIHNGSSNLIVGETYSPPGFWSGIPLHCHDKDDACRGESDLEEIYFHRLGVKTLNNESFPQYAVQLLFDECNLNKAYVVKDRTIVAIPGACHPAVASPSSDLLYLWGLAGKGTKLMMRDVLEFKYLRNFENIFETLKKQRGKYMIDKKRFEELCAPYDFTKEQKRILKLYLMEMDFDII